MPPRCKKISNLFVEIVLFVSLFTILGHLTVNFWERYMIQTELTRMKTSLHGLKYTIDVIGNAYDNFHEELKVLAHISEPNGKSRSIYTDKAPQPSHILAHSDSGRVTKNPSNPQTANIIKDIYAQVNINDQEQFTITDSTERADKIVTTPSIRDKLQNTETFEKKDVKTYTSNTMNVGNPAKRQLASIKTNTRNPLVSTAVGRGSAHNREIQTFTHCRQRDPYSQQNSKIHQCHRDEITVNK